MRLGKLFGHPIHQRLAVIPWGLFAATVAFDLAYVATSSIAFADIGYWTLAAGLIGAVAAAVFGVWDLLSIPAATRARAVGVAHGLVNGVAALRFAVSWLMRRMTGHVPGREAIVVAVVGLAVASVGGWLGGEMVLRYGVGVHPDAGLEPFKAPAPRRRHGTMSPLHR